MSIACDALLVAAAYFGGALMLAIIWEFTRKFFGFPHGSGNLPRPHMDEPQEGREVMRDKPEAVPVDLLTEIDIQLALEIGCTSDKACLRRCKARIDELESRKVTDEQVTEAMIRAGINALDFTYLGPPEGHKTFLVSSIYSEMRRAALQDGE